MRRVLQRSSSGFTSERLRAPSRSLIWPSVHASLIFLASPSRLLKGGSLEIDPSYGCTCLACRVSKSELLFFRIVAGLGAILAAALVFRNVFGPFGLIASFEGLTVYVMVMFSAVAIFLGWIAARLHNTDSRKLMRSGCLGGLVIGGIAFLGGFIGPIILMPEANQGPFLGILLTGPLGWLLGTIFGVTREKRRQIHRKESEAIV